MRRGAKIAGTLGPSSETPKTLAAMVEAGLDVARLNYSHGTPEDHERRVKRLRAVSRRVGRAVCLMSDLQGPRFRVGDLPGGSCSLEAGAAVQLVAGRKRAPPGKIPVSYAALARDVERGDRVLIDDGNVELVVERVRDRTVHCQVARGGVVSDHKGINLPGTRLSAPALTPKDRKDLAHAVSIGADWLAVSFVRRAADVKLARRLTRKEGRELPIMAKIERPEALDDLDAILKESDGLLVARGDLGVELPPEDVPVLQKQIIAAARDAGKPVMTATQMLESMRSSKRPTRAEASDVANAILDGSDALLLTAETAVGTYPVEAVAMMARIILRTEGSDRVERPKIPERGLAVAASTCLAACRSAYEVGARYIAVFTQTGFSARQVARYRPRTPILAFAGSPEVARQLRMVWGVRPRAIPAYASMEKMIAAVDRALLREGLVDRKDLVVLAAGSPVGKSGTTNFMKIHAVGEPVI